MRCLIPLNNSKSIGLESLSTAVFIILGLLDIEIIAARGDTDDGKFMGVDMPRYVSDGWVPSSNYNHDDESDDCSMIVIVKVMQIFTKLILIEVVI